MYLKTLRMRGFKSFAQSVELRFEHGIAVVVGPNGSGKSNIADALQWAMAVQSPAQLRAPSGQDVLFGGTDSRPPSGICEVELVLDNECETLPIEFGEVSVMRRLHRDGESEYFINRARVRRLDVLELLSDTGLGREMHSVIGQGKVEEILLAKPHERRRFVEEAAGLGKFQRRRTRAEQKLARVEAELERARDLEREVRARLRPLAMQATAAERAAKLGQEIAQGRIALLSSELLVEHRREAQLRGRLQEAQASRAGVDGELAAIHARRSAAENELGGLAAAQERAARAFYGFETGRERVEAERSRMRRARAALERTEAWRRDEAARLRDEAARLRREGEASEAAAAEHVAEAAGIEAQEGGGLDEAAAAAEAALAAALDARRAHAEAEGQSANLRREQEASAARVLELRDRLEKLGTASAGEAAQLQAAEAAVTELAARLEAAAAAVSDGQTAAEQAEAAATLAQQRAGELRLAAQRADEEHAAGRARLESLEVALTRGDGLSPGVQALRDRGARLVVAGIEAEPGFERAVAAALGWRAGAVVADRLEDALDLLDASSGEVSVVMAGSNRGADGVARPDGARPLADVARVADPSLAPLLDGIWLVEDLRAVRSGVAVTAAGTGMDADRGEVWRTAEAGEASWLRVRAERDALAASIEELSRAAQAAAVRAGEESAAAERSAAEDAAARERLRAARREEQEASDLLRQAAAGRDSLADELARRDAARDLGERDLEVETRRLTELQALLAGHEAGLAERRRAALAADERHAGLEMTRRRLADEAARRAARIAALSERIERFRGDAARAQEHALRSESLAEAADRASREAAGAVPAVDRLLAELEAVMQAAGRLAEPARAGIDSIERRASELSGELQECATVEAEIQGRARTIQTAATEVEVSMARCAERMDDLGRRRTELAAERQIEITEPEEPLEPDEAAAAAARLERLERRRESLGAVNPLASEEYEQEKVRADDLSTQCDDLETSLTELKALIKDLTKTIDERFSETFESVAHNFEEVIGTLFPGGRGRLRLTEERVQEGEPGEQESDDVVDASSVKPQVERGIELEVKPAGKRIESLSLLSGGEKSLTAIAFLFALMLTKPSPFYLLDEVEAALDDANIDRFLDLLRAYQDRAQFLVVTHQRRTMEVADVLYGVTMAGDGVSTVLSRRMPSDPVLHEAALESA